MTHFIGVSDINNKFTFLNVFKIIFDFKRGYLLGMRHEKHTNISMCLDFQDEL